MTVLQKLGDGETRQTLKESISANQCCCQYTIALT